MNIRKLQMAAIVVVTALAAINASLIGQTTTTWIGGGGNNLFNNGLNWSGSAPGLGDEALFNTMSPSSLINVIFDEEIRTLSVAGPATTLSGPSSFVVEETVEVKLASELNLINQISLECETLFVADISFPECTVSNSTIDANTIRIGTSSLNQRGIMSVSNGGNVSTEQSTIVFDGFATVTGNSSQWIVGQELRIGVGATNFTDARFDVLDGGFASAAQVNVGFNGTGTGCLNVDGGQSELSCNGDMNVGFFVPGEVSITNFSQVSVGVDVNISQSSCVSISNNAALDVAGNVLNFGDVSFLGAGIIVGDFQNLVTGRLQVNASGVGNITGDLIHLAEEISVANGGQLLICGNWTGSGQFVGSGRVDFEFGVQPGDGIGAVAFEGDVNFGSDVQAVFEFGGTVTGTQYDQMQIDNDLTLDGSLTVSLTNGFLLGPDMEFVIIEIGGDRTGTFDNLAEGSLVGTFGGNDLFITYAGGDGNDIAVFTNPSTVLLGDINLDGFVNLLDVAPFVNLISTGNYQIEGDINMDGIVNLLDVGPFVQLLSGS